LKTAQASDTVTAHYNIIQIWAAGDGNGAIYYPATYTILDDEKFF